MRCERVQLLLSDRADGRLDPLSGWRVDRHLHGCPRCAAEWDQVRTMTDALQLLRDPEPVPDFRERLRQAASDLPPAAAGEPLPAYEPETRRRRGRRALLGVALTSAAAAVVVSLLTLSPRPAGAIQRTLDAMAAVKTAYATGELTYWGAHRGQAPKPSTLRVTYWYEAPDYYHVRQRAEPSSSHASNDLTVKAGKADALVEVGGGRWRRYDIGTQDTSSTLSPFAFFPSGAAARIIRLPGTRVEPGYDRLHGERVRTYRLVRESPGSLSIWRLWVDRRSHLILQAVWERYGQTDTGWKKRATARLDRFEYNLHRQEPPGP